MKSIPAGARIGVDGDAHPDEEDSMKVADVMRRDVTTVAPQTPLRDVAMILAERRISGLPVVDADEVVGVVSEADILMKERSRPDEPTGLLARVFTPRDDEAEAKLMATTAAEAMSAPAVTVEPTMPLGRAAAIMADRGINRLPVVDGGALVGIVTRADLVRAFVRDDTAIHGEIENDVVLKQFWLPPGSVNTRVENGVVTLGGSVERRSVAELLAAVVERVPGVVSVTSNLTWQEDDRS